MICCLFSLYKLSVPDYLSKKDLSRLNSLSQETWDLILHFKSLYVSEIYLPRHISGDAFIQASFYWQVNKNSFGSKQLCLSDHISL